MCPGIQTAIAIFESMAQEIKANWTEHYPPRSPYQEDADIGSLRTFLHSLEKEMNASKESAKKAKDKARKRTKKV